MPPEGQESGGHKAEHKATADEFADDSNDEKRLQKAKKAAGIKRSTRQEKQEEAGGVPVCGKTPNLLPAWAGQGGA